VMRRPVRFLTAGSLAFVLAIAVVSTGLIQMNFFVADPMRLFYINLDMPSEAPLEETLRQTVLVEQEALKHFLPGEVRAVTVNAGIKFTDAERLYGDQYGQVQVSLTPATGDSRRVGEIVDSLREPLSKLPVDGLVSFQELSGGPPAAKPVSVKVRADDFVELRAASDAMINIVKNIPGTKDVVDNDVPGRQELVLDLDYTVLMPRKS